jgi:serine/threonine-protein kinase
MFGFVSVYSFSWLITMSSTIPYQKASALAARVIVRAQAPSSLTPSSATQNSTTYSDLADGISIQYPSGWEKIEYPAVPLSSTGYKVVVNFLAPIVNASDQWREYLMIQVLNQSAVKSLVPQVNTTLAGNPGYKLVYTNNEESFHLKTLEVWTTIGDHTYLLIYKAEATKYSGYLPIIQRMLDSFRVGVSPG